MARIVKSDDAPEGVIKVSVANETLRVEDDKGAETDNEVVLAYAHASPLFDVTDEDDPREAAKEEHKAIREFEREGARADKQRAEKDPREAPAPKPEGPEVR